MSEAKSDEALIAYLKQFVTTRRWERITSILEERTRYITVVLEDIYQPHNASAVLRSCEGFGIQDVHVIENRNRFTISSGVALGTSSWLDIHRYREDGAENTLKAVQALKAKGYRIVATSPHAQDINLEDFDISAGKSAFLFGNELEGASQQAMALADEFMKIPMRGFVESFNISVSCAIVLHHLSWKLRELDPSLWKLNEEEKGQILLTWLRKSIKSADSLEEHFRQQQ
ncbi:TrmH family RNA methyltransferase [Sediminispirochaeta bajacaliforniensis]|uniref:TrmH family RNA methyltransferase n=1 Tax=Sediminispirochaeta bajacaliforniensis TaxID=148 RepID=UPI0003815FB3|nr:RNA methyltransferase [Sediminispirochaeta bajacaliforniensis]